MNGQAKGYINIKAKENETCHSKDFLCQIIRHMETPFLHLQKIKINITMKILLFCSFYNLLHLFFKQIFKKFFQITILKYRSWVN